MDKRVHIGRNTRFEIEKPSELDERDRQIKTMQAKIGELVLELDARKKLQALNDQEEENS